MPAVLVRLVEIAHEQGVRRVVTYVSSAELSFIRFFIRLGFQPFAIRRESRRLLRRRITFEELDAQGLPDLRMPGALDALLSS
jgi:RimJ/RimL family protein N-acetyltransferase